MYVYTLLGGSVYDLIYITRNVWKVGLLSLFLCCLSLSLSAFSFFFFPSATRGNLFYAPPKNHLLKRRRMSVGAVSSIEKRARVVILHFTLRGTTGGATMQPSQPLKRVWMYHVTKRSARRCAPPESHVTLAWQWIGSDSPHSIACGPLHRIRVKQSVV